jgi:hypothetical protein
VKRRHRNPAQRLRTTVEALPERTRRAMLRGMDANSIIVGAYTDRRTGGICPMLAAHRNGGRTNLGSFALAWDAFTDARRPRLATRRELRTLRSYLEMSLLDEAQSPTSITRAAAQIRAERAAAPRPAARGAAADEIRITRPRPTGERHRARDLRDRLRWAWMRPTRRYDDFSDLIAAASEQLAEDRTDAQTVTPRPSPGRSKTISGTRHAGDVVSR